MRRPRWYRLLWIPIAFLACGADGQRGGTSDGGGVDGGGRGGVGTGGGATGGGGTGGGGTGGTAIDGILVTTPSGQVASGSADGTCDILEAIAAARAGSTVGDCANATGSRRVLLTGGNSYPVRKTLRFDATASDQTFSLALADGTGGTAAISAVTDWFADPGDPTSSCLISASGGATLALSDVALTQAPSFSLTGACVSRGDLEARRVHVSGFRRGGLSATCLPTLGCDHETNFDDGATLRVLNSLVEGNSNTGDGGGIFSQGSGATVSVFNSAIVNNSAEGGGGGLYLAGGWNTNIIQASTVSDNRAGVGGGVMVKFFCSNTYLNVYSSTIAYNTASGTGGGIEFEPADRSCATQDVSVFSSIVAGNHSTNSFESNINAAWHPDDPQILPAIFNCTGSSFIYVAPGLPTPTNLDGGCAFDARDARLGPLVPMGGAGNLPAHPLLAGSPAIDIAGMDVGDQRDEWITGVDPTPAPSWELFSRQIDGNGDGTAAPDLGAIEMNPRWQTELLSVAAKGPSPHRIVMQPAGFDNGAGTEYAATGATNEFVTYVLPVPEPGDYDLTLGLLKTPDAGQLQLAIGHSADGPWTALGPVLDGYAATPTFAALGPFALPKFATAGETLLRASVTGKDAASTGYKLSLDYVDALKSSAPCSVAQIAAGASHTCALLASGGVRCWGGNDAGQLGDGTTTDGWRVPAVDVLAGAKAIAAGGRHSCAVTSAGGVRCWGANDAGQLGDGSTTARSAPPTADVLAGVVAVAAGSGHTCALTAAGGVRCWGANEAGQLGDGTIANRSTPPASDVLTGVKAIAAGGSVTCALTVGGGVRCWGANGVGQLGDGSTTDRARPPTTDVMAGVTAISVASGHTCVVTTTGGVRCWGHDGNSELGTGMYTDDVLSPPTTDALAGTREVAAGLQFTCALTTAGGVRCWGYNSDGQIGDETPNAVDRLAPATTDILDGASALAVGQAHACSLMSGGGVRCWGANSVGQLGDGLAPDAAATPPTIDIAGFAGTCRH